MGSGRRDKTHFAQRKPNWEPRAMHDGLQLASLKPLEDQPRSACPQCGKSRSWYCPECVTALSTHPRVSLPLQVHIVTHPEENRKSNTDDATPVDTLDVKTLKHVYIIDRKDAQRAPYEERARGLTAGGVTGTRWHKATHIMRQPEFASMRKVKLSGGVQSSFWRFHTEGVCEDGVVAACPVDIATAAMLALLPTLEPELQQHSELAEEFKSEHAFDNLMWYFAHEHAVVHSAFLAKKRQRTESAGRAAAREAGTSRASASLVSNENPV